MDIPNQENTDAVKRQELINELKSKRRSRESIDQYLELEGYPLLSDEEAKNLEETGEQPRPSEMNEAITEMDDEFRKKEGPADE